MTLYQTVLWLIILVPTLSVLFWLGRYKLFWKYLAVVIFVPTGVFIVFGAIFLLMLS